MHSQFTDQGPERWRKHCCQPQAVDRAAVLIHNDNGIRNVGVPAFYGASQNFPGALQRLVTSRRQIGQICTFFVDSQIVTMLQMKKENTHIRRS